ncbi:acyl-CoA dehydrogenase family protein [Actinomadura atramentaria]|uniref:acyl-CoA dehydrogenase family protein n=1 Tax=Actinomadura atramentaria TaxID=1990 RepID=UPI0003785948|nr:acyl-CoA dehydrogenase family protein [Actinomadura atramentaria]
MPRTIFEDDHEALRATARTFAERVLAPGLDRFAAEGGIDRDVWREAGRLGLLGLEVPERYGGAGAGDYRFNAVVAEEFAAVSLGAASSWGVHADVCAPYLVRLTSDEQRARWLPGVCSGELWTAVAMTEPSGGSDLSALRTTAVRDGGDWVLNGAKTFITNGRSADLVIVAARTDPAAGAFGISLFAVEAGTPGFERGAPLDKIGQHESDTAELFFADARVPGANLIGRPGKGFPYLMRMLPQERLGSAVVNLAHAARVLDGTLAHARAREAFGKPIGSLQHNKFVLADLATSLDVARAYVDHCITLHRAGAMSAVDAAKAKWWTAETQNRIVDACLQLHGGYGYMAESAVARAWTAARVTKIWAGANEVMKDLIGADLGL